MIRHDALLIMMKNTLAVFIEKAVKLKKPDSAQVRLFPA
jgi:hypothetical protein